MEYLWRFKWSSLDDDLTGFSHDSSSAEQNPGQYPFLSYVFLFISLRLRTLGTMFNLSVGRAKTSFETAYYLLFACFSLEWISYQNYFIKGDFDSILKFLWHLFFENQVFNSVSLIGLYMASTKHPKFHPQNVRINLLVVRNSGTHHW